MYIFNPTATNSRGFVGHVGYVGPVGLWVYHMGL